MSNKKLQKPNITLNKKNKNLSNQFELKTKTDWKPKIFYSLAIVGILALLGLGVMASNDWFPKTDSLSGKRTGWFGKKIAKNAPASWNPFANSTPHPTPQLSKEYIYAGTRLLAVEDANANAAPPADLAIWRPSTGAWWVLGSDSQQTSQNWGANGDIPAPGDFDGDGKTDFCVFRASAQIWYVVKSSDGGAIYFFFGMSGDKAVPADYDGDGKTDPAVFRDSNGTWYIQYSTTGQLLSHQFGQVGDKPTPKDFDGDGKADIGFWRETGTPTFYSLNSSDGSLALQTYGLSGDVPSAADYDGDGKADYAVRRGASWYILQSSNSQTISYNWGISSDIEVPNDYDGDGRADIAVWRNSNGTWYILNSSNGSYRITQWGMAGDIPVAAYYRR